MNNMWSSSVVLVVLVASCRTKPEDRLLAVGGTHNLQAGQSCHVEHVEPASALKDLHWQDKLTFAALGEGNAELVCDKERTRLRFVKPTWLELTWWKEPLPIGKEFQVRAVPHDQHGRALEIGQWSQVDWRAEGAITPHPDRSAHEFGFCPTCFGQETFRVTATGPALIEAKMGALTGTVRINVQP